ncbi:MAG: hypothetical protein ABJB66_20255 [Gemmatimonadaceae bacterium]
MKRISLAAAAALLLVSSSVAFGLVLRHGTWAAAVKGTDGMKLHGSATVKATADDKQTMVDFKIENDVAGSVRPWHIHSGSCAKTGGVVGGGGNYPAITVDAKGNGEGKATLSMVVPDTGMYYINVHESKENMGHSVACGDLKHKM